MINPNKVQSGSGVEDWLDQIEGDPNIKAKDADDLREIGIALLAIDQAEEDLVGAVGRARMSGSSWTEVANVLGVSRQAARQRFSDRVPGLGPMNATAGEIYKRADGKYTYRLKAGGRVVADGNDAGYKREADAKAALEDLIRRMTKR